MAKQTIASSNMLPWHSCHWVRTAAYQTKAPFIKNVARASRWLYCEDALHHRFEAGHSAPTEIHGRLPPSPYRPRRHMGGGRSPVLVTYVKVRIGDAHHTVTSDRRVMSLRRSSTQHSNAGSWQNKQRRAQHMRRCNAPSDDLRPSGEDPSRIAVIIDEAHSGIPDDGAFIKNMAAKRYGKRHTQCTTSRMSQAYCQGWSHTLPRPTRQSVLSGDTICLVSCARSDSGWGPMAVLYEGPNEGGPREAFPPHSYIPECWQPT